ncbi:hypothetical protein [Actinomadura vinacea]
MGTDETIVRWRWVYGYDEDPPGGFVFGDMALQADGVLQWRTGDSPWSPFPWWPGEKDPQRAEGILRSRGYELHPA